MFLRHGRTTEQSDEDLVRSARKGHQASLGVLWDRYAHLLFGVAMKYLKDVEAAKDAVLEVFTDLPVKLAAHEVECFRPWVHVVMRNHCLGILRRKDLTVPIGQDLPPAEDVKGEAALREADLERLEAAIERLNVNQRICIRLFHIERLSYREVADRTGLSVEQVRSHLQNGRRNLRCMLLSDADQDQ